MTSDYSPVTSGEALATLRANGVKARQTSPYQIKVGTWNFWPDTGTITRDGERGKRKERGLEDLLALVTGRKQIEIA